MSTQVGIGRSFLRDPQRAGHDAVADALTVGGMTEAQLVLLFATVGYDQQLLVQAVREASGGATLCGCSCEGVIVQDTPDESNFAVAVLALRSDQLRFTTGLTASMSTDPRQLGASIAAAIPDEALADAQALFLFPDGLTVDFDGLQQGLEEGLALDRVLPLLGGTAADNWKYSKTYQYHDDSVISDGVAWAVLSGDVQVVSAVNHGCTGLGIPHEITSAEGTTIHEIDGRPALDVMHEYMTAEEMEDWAIASVNLPLAFDVPAEPGRGDTYPVRVMLTRDDASGSFTIPTRVKPGTRVWMARRDFDKVISGVGALAEELKAQLQGNVPVLVLQFECAGRGRAFLRDEQKRELVRQLHEHVPATTWFGFYSYGEIGPLAGSNRFHNYTSVLAAIF